MKKCLFLLLKLCFFSLILSACLDITNIRAENNEDHFEVDECIIGDDEINNEQLPMQEQPTETVEDINKNEVTDEKRESVPDKRRNENKTITKKESDQTEKEQSADPLDKTDSLDQNIPKNFRIPGHNTGNTGNTAIDQGNSDFSSGISDNSSDNIINNTSDKVSAKASENRNPGLDDPSDRRENKKEADTDQQESKVWLLFLILASVIFVTGCIRLLRRICIHYGKLKDAML